MLRARTPACLFCEFRKLLRWSQPLQPVFAPPRRHASQLQRRRPSRMVLSQTVSKPPPRASAGKQQANKGRASPFGGMNRTDAGHLPPPRTRHAAGHAGSRRKGAKKDKTGTRQNDMKALKMQQALARVSYGHRANVKQNINLSESFEDFTLLPIVQEALKKDVLKDLTDVTPTPVQRLAIPALLGTGDKKGRRGAERGTSDGMRQFLMAAETGSGKTLAYLMPVLDAIKRAETAESHAKIQEETLKAENHSLSLFEVEPPTVAEGRHPDAGRPRAIILQPSSELVDQVGAVVKAFSHCVKFRSALLSASYSATVIRNRLFAPTGIDVVVSTPYLLGNLAESDPNILSRVSHLVIDEADSLFDRSFAPLTSAIIDKASPSLQQLIMCSATIPRSLDSYLHKRFPDITRLVTPNLHAIPRRVQLTVTDIDKDPYRGNRDLACADTIWSIGQASSDSIFPAAPTEVKRIIVFVNEREKAQELAEYLTSKGIDATALNRDTTAHRQSETLTAFTSQTPIGATTPTVEEQIRQATSGARTLPNVKVLVMTDLGSRGIDTVAVRNVVLYDVPHSTIDFIHRLGRVGRMGRRGRGVVLVGKGDRRDVVREVREGMFRGQALI